MTHEDEIAKLLRLAKGFQTDIEHSSCLNEDLRSQMLQRESRLSATPSSSSLSDPVLEQDRLQSQRVLDLAARAKEADLRALSWRMSFEGEAERADRAESRLNMVQEDFHSHSQLWLSMHREMVPADSVEICQSRISLLEEHVRDMQSQVACDREQFGYEQAKWEHDKNSAHQELQEIHDVSVKLLKVLVIREKLLKKRERKASRRVEAFQHETATVTTRLKQIVQTLMEEGASLLLVVQQLSVHRVGNGQPLAVKPAHLRSLIKQLKRLEQSIDRLGAAAPCNVDNDSSCAESAVSDDCQAITLAAQSVA